MLHGEEAGVAAQSSSSSTSSSTSNRHLELQERFKAQQEARAQSRKDSKERGAEFRDPKECIGVFWTELRKTYEGVVEGLDKVREKHQVESSRKAATNDDAGAAAAAASEGLNRIGTQIQALEKRITDAAIFLPPYDVRRAQEEVATLQSKLEGTRTALAPRKKFSFASRRSKSSAESNPDEESSSSTTSSSSQPCPSASLRPPASSTNGRSTAAAAAAPVVANGGGSSRMGTESSSSSKALQMEGFSSQSDCRLDIKSLTSNDQQQKHPTDLLLRALNRCTIYLLEPLSFLRMEDLKDCRVYCGPVAGPVYLENVQGSTIFLMSRQLRIHNTSDCDLYVHTISGPIIEDCHGLRFAPFSLSYPKLTTHMQEAQLAGAENAWAEVKDFKWLKAHQSPHWSIMPESERIQEIVTAAVDVQQQQEEEEDEI